MADLALSIFLHSVTSKSTDVICNNKKIQNLQIIFYRKSKMSNTSVIDANCYQSQTKENGLKL